MNWITQIIALTGFNVRTLRQRLGSSASAIFGIAGVVGVLIGVLSIAEGFRRAMTVSGKPDTALVMRSGSDTEMSSILDGDEAKIVADAEGIARTNGVALASSELFVIINLPKRSTRTDANVPLRGIAPAAFDVRGDVEIVEGRLFEWGKNEVIAGIGAKNEFVGLEVGASIPVGRQEWTVVGVFRANGGIAESEIWTDAGVLQPAYRRGNTVPGRLHAARERRPVSGFQGPSHDRPPAQREGGSARRTTTPSSRPRSPDSSLPSGRWSRRSWVSARCSEL